MSDLNIGCLGCGCKMFNVTGKINSLDELDGAICSNCGRAFSKREAEVRINKAIADNLRNSIGKLRLK